MLPCLFGTLQASLRKQYSEENFVVTENEINIIMRRGYALDVEAYDPDLNCVAIPIFFKNRPVAVLCVSGPSFRFKEPQFLESLRIMDSILMEHEKYKHKINV